MNTENNIEDIAKETKILGASKVDIVGAWIWAYFDGKPADYVRARLKELGYHWNKKRICWQYAGVPCRHSNFSTSELYYKYGAEEVKQTALIVR